MGEHITLEEAIIRRETLHQDGKILVFTNGHFDLLHVGHLDYLEKARELGDALYLGLNGDASTTRLKGAGRPLVPASERARLLAALILITAVIVFEEDTAIREVPRPDGAVAADWIPVFRRGIQLVVIQAKGLLSKVRRPTSAR